VGSLTPADRTLLQLESCLYVQRTLLDMGGIVAGLGTRLGTGRRCWHSSVGGRHRRSPVSTLPDARTGRARTTITASSNPAGEVAHSSYMVARASRVPLRRGAPASVVLRRLRRVHFLFPGTSRRDRVTCVNATIWVPLVAATCAAVGSLGGGLVGVLITQRKADRRERENRASELERERERWAREDDEKTFDHRRVAYVEFYESLRRAMGRVSDHGIGLSDDGSEQLPSGWQAEAWEKLQIVDVYGAPGISMLGIQAYLATLRWGGTTVYNQDDAKFRKGEAAADEAKALLLEGIRSDLRIADDIESSVVAREPLVLKKLPILRSD
jgi:hypothetical protein